MNISFTGTQAGMTLKQKEVFKELIRQRLEGNWIRFHHGDCVGADEDAFNIVFDFSYTETIAHPGHDKEGHSPKRVYTKSHIILPSEPYLPRNHEMVDITDELIATPKEFKEQLRSGTWATIRYARNQNKPVTIIYPDGSID